MTSRIRCANCGGESFADGATLYCASCYDNLANQPPAELSTETLRTALAALLKYPPPTSDNVEAAITEIRCALLAR